VERADPAEGAELFPGLAAEDATRGAPLRAAEELRASAEIIQGWEAANERAAAEEERRAPSSPRAVEDIERDLVVIRTGLDLRALYAAHDSEIAGGVRHLVSLEKDSEAIELEHDGPASERRRCPTREPSPEHIEWFLGESAACERHELAVLAERAALRVQVFRARAAMWLWTMGEACT
jgi:hypothetical protein